MIAANTIMFAIQAGVWLYGAGRRAYIADTRQRGLILPLIRGPELTILDAVSWYVDRTVDGGKFLDRPESAELKRLTDAFLEEAGNDEDKHRRNEAILDRYA